MAKPRDPTGTHHAEPPEVSYLLQGMEFGVLTHGSQVELRKYHDGGHAVLTKFDLCPTWLRLAFHQAKAAKSYNGRLVRAWKKPNRDLRKVQTALEREFEASMIAITATAIATDAFYANVLENVEIDPSLRVSWRQNKTARYSQIAEVFSRSFLMAPADAKMISLTASVKTWHYSEYLKL